jgi:hypothetical protein
MGACGSKPKPAYEALKKSIERWDLVAQEDRYYECRKS